MTPRKHVKFTVGNLNFNVYTSTSKPILYHSSSYKPNFPFKMSEEASSNAPTAPQDSVTTKRERSPEVKPAQAAPAPADIGEEDAFNEPTPSKKPKFEKKNKKEFKPKSPYPGRGKRDDRPQLTEEERREKEAAKDRLRAERKLADEERMANVNDEDRRLPKRRCALLIG